MKKGPQQIAKQIFELVSELAALAGMQPDGMGKSLVPLTPRKKGKAGPVAGIRLLIQDGKLDSPLFSAEIINLLKQDGKHYPTDSVLVGLLRLVRERVLTRLK